MFLSLEKIVTRTLVFALLLFAGFNIVTAQPIEPLDPPAPSVVQSDGWTLVPEACLGDSASDFEMVGTGEFDANGNEIMQRGAPVCGFPEFMQLIANLMGLFVVIALSLAVLLFSYAGFKYATSAGDPGALKSAKTIFTNVAIGLAIVFLAYTIVQVIASVLQVDREGGFNEFLQDYQ